MVAAGKRKRAPSPRRSSTRRSRISDSESNSDDEGPTQPTQRRDARPVTSMSDDEEGMLDFTQPELPQQLSQVAPPAEVPPEEGRGVPARIAQLSKKTISDLTARLVRFLLYKASANLPVKFADIGKEVLTNEPKVGRHILKLASVELERVFGYRVVAVDDIMPNGAGKKDVFLVINALEDQTHLLHINKCYGKTSRGLLMMIFAFIWCAPSRRLVEEDLWKQLKLVDKSIATAPGKHPLGDIAQLLKAFEAQMYLASDSEIDGEAKRVKFYTYGPRAFAEVGKVQIVTFLSKLIHNRPPSQELLKELALEMQNEQE
ncbi:hypothetical protein ACHHYP_12447 [Achlya hypogyna]|uniref:MAGE domain-containing protein n=1 Tax=Achlya hypogyna TaxID=1202772 RepID=A0A1V9YGW1_ACHHY|nr:hypothetical protein ACHHYP_12447 [Achlya hypogyna]